MNNYYKILQVDKDASPEMIKVAYKLLVKKYHPDLKEGAEKTIAEIKIKEINEAYEVLYDRQKRAQYDQTLFNKTVSPEQYQLVINENTNLKKELNYYRKTYNSNNYKRPHYTNMYANNPIPNKSYYNPKNTSNTELNNNIFNLDFLKKQLTEKIKLILALIITMLIFLIIIKLPFVKGLLSNYINGEYLIIFIFIIIGYYYFFKNKQ